VITPTQSPVLTPTRVWAYGLSLAAAWALFAIWFTVASVAGVITTITLLAITIRLTARVAQVTDSQHELHNRLEAESRSLGNRLERLLGGIPSGKTIDRPSMAASPLSPRLLSEMAAACEVGGEMLAKLRAQQVQTNAVLENLDSGVLVVDQQSRVVLANDAVKRFFSISWQPVGKPLVEAIRQPQVLDAVRQVMSDRSAREVVVDLRNEAGDRRVLRVLCAAVRFEEVTAVLLAARDESESHRVEETRREFVANVSHELKTPLAAIKGYAETVEMAIKDDPDAAIHFVSQIQGQCDRLERLIADMMTLARAQAGKQHLRPATVDVDAVIADSIATYAPIAAAKGIDLRHEHSGASTVLAFADREATLTIANNVIGNAIRYTPDGGVVVVSSRRDGEFAVFSVRDNGIGIPQHEQRRVFERFYRAEKSRKHTSSGTGLGLAIVKNLTQSQGGRVSLKSRPGKGSTFEIYLPEPSIAATTSPPQAG
jgi:two-component system, OmpR family, phosphate regulon sensor histidine kinase PhoR